MFYHLFLKTIVSALFVSTALAAPAKKSPPMTHYMAVATANAVNRWGTVDEYRKVLGRYVSASEMAQLNAEFTKYGIQPTDRFPKMMSKDNKAYFDKDNFILYDKKTMTVNGKKLSLTKAKPSDLFAQICGQVGCKKTTAEFSLFPKAHALFGRDFDSKKGLLGALALGAGAALFTDNQSPQGRKQAMFRGGLAGFLLAGLFLNDETSHACAGNCEVQCDGNDYTIRRDNDYTYMGESYRGSGRGGRSGGTRIYADDFRNNPGSYDVRGGTNHGACNGSSSYRDELACDIGARNCSSGGGGSGGSGDELSDDIGSATVVDKNNGEAQRGTTSLPVKKK